MVRLRATYSSELSQLAAMRAFTGEVCRLAWGSGANEEAIYQLQLALTEAAVNIIRHAYRGETNHSIDLLIEVVPESVSLTLFHHGDGFDPESVAPPSFDGSRQGGFGVFMIRELTDEVSYVREEGGPHAIRMVKRPNTTPTREMNMQPTVEVVGDVTVVTPNVEHFDASNADDFKRDVASALKDQKKMVLDLSRVQFVDSSGCGAILSCLKTLTENQGDLKICHVNKYVRSVFELIRLHRICDIVDTRDEAIRAFQKTN
jgi:anti-sigma B factor antagonist